MLQEEMITIRTSQQSQTQESTGECTTSGSAQFAPPRMTKDDINFSMRGQRRGHMKGVGRQLTRVTGPSSTAACSLNSVLAPTPSQSNAIPQFIHKQVAGMI